MSGLNETDRLEITIERNKSLLQQLGFETNPKKAIKKQKKMLRKPLRKSKRIQSQDRGYQNTPKSKQIGKHYTRSSKKKTYTYTPISERRQPPQGFIVENGRRTSARLKVKDKVDYASIDDTPEEVYGPTDVKKVVVMFTGIVDAPKYEAGIKKLGGQIETDDVKKVTHLITTNIKRTVKFMCGICKIPNIMDINWLIQSDKSGYFVKEEQFKLEDTKSEEKYGFSLQDAMKAAQKKPVFEGKFFYLTENIQPSAQELAQVVDCSGGKVIQDVQSIKDFTNFYVISSEEDKQFCKEKLKDVPLNCFHETEFVIHSIFQQKVDNSVYLITLNK